MHFIAAALKGTLYKPDTVGDISYAYILKGLSYMEIAVIYLVHAGDTRGINIILSSLDEITENREDSEEVLLSYIRPKSFSEKKALPNSLGCIRKIKAYRRIARFESNALRKITKNIHNDVYNNAGEV